MTKSGSSGTLDLLAAGVGVRLVGLEHLGADSAGWVRAALRPFAAPLSDPDVNIEVCHMNVKPGRRIEGGLALIGDALWVGDRWNRGAILEPHNGHLGAVVSHDIPSRLLADLYLLLVDAALARQGGMLVRMAAVQTATQRVGVSGWSGSGKSRLVLTLLRVHGASLIGDSVVGCLPDGTVAPVGANLKVRPELRDLLPMEARVVSASRSWIARKLESSNAGSNTTPRFPAGRFGPLLAERVRSGGERQVDGARLSSLELSGGRLSSLVLIRRPSEVAPSDFLLSTTDAYMNRANLVRSVARGISPKASDMRLRDHARHELIAEMVRHARVIEMTPPLLPMTAHELAAGLVV